jgi:hypothetical protein
MKAGRRFDRINKIYRIRRRDETPKIRNPEEPLISAGRRGCCLGVKAK